MREHAPRSTRLAGAITAATATLAFGYAMANGLGGYITANLPDPITYVVLPDETPTTPPPPSTDDLTLTDADAWVVVDPLYISTVFDIEPTRLTAATEPETRRDPGPDISATPAPSRVIRTAPKMLPVESPPYPASERRKNNQGISVLDVCLDARGRVSSASLAGSSGHPVLDREALKWVRNLEFTPAKVDGKPQAICGHSVSYEWTLKRP